MSVILPQLTARDNPVNLPDVVGGTALIGTEADERIIRWQRLDQAVGLGALAGAFVLYLSIGDWSPAFYAFCRLIVVSLSLFVAYWAWQRTRKGWLAFAIIGATIFLMSDATTSDRSWDLVGLVYGVSYGLLGINLIHPKLAGPVTWAFGLCAAIALTLTFYVNYYMPHGPKYSTGDVVCQHDGQGPCGEAMVEDMSELDIPDWAKFLRKNLVWTLFFLVGGAVLASARSQQRK